MRAAVVTRLNPTDPLAGLALSDVPEPVAHAGWTIVEVKAAALNHHDLWSLRGVGLGSEQLPMILGTDAAGVTADGREVVVHAVVGSLSPIAGDSGPAGERRTLLSEKYPGTLAQRVAVPTANLVDKPAALSFAQAACLPTSWLTAYRLLFEAAAAVPGDSILVQGARGGVASAAIALAAAAGLTVFATSRDAEGREFACRLGAAAAFEPGERLPTRVDAVIETVGKATWDHSLRSVRPGGVIAVAGATSGDAGPAGLSRIFFQEIRVQGVTMGSTDQLRHLLVFLEATGVRPALDLVLPLDQVKDGLARMAAGHQLGKIVITP